MPIQLIIKNVTLGKLFNPSLFLKFLACISDDNML